MSQHCLVRRSAGAQAVASAQRQPPHVSHADTADQRAAQQRRGGLQQQAPEGRAAPARICCWEELLHEGGHTCTLLLFSSSAEYLQSI